MTYPSCHRLNWSLAVTAFVVALLVVALLWGSVPRSLASRAAASSLSYHGQNMPAVTFAGIYQQTNLVSDLPGVAFIEDRQLVNPWGVAFNSTSPFWVVNNKTDRATIYKGDVNGGA